MIEVTQTDTSDPLAFDVLVSERGSASRHAVTLSRADPERLGWAEASADDLVQAAFRFLLDREPKEAILAHFELPVISSYFPEFEAELPSYLARGRT